MTDISKALKPQESVILSPLNEGTEFKANNYILFRISAAQLNMWIVNDSYLTFDLVYTRQAHTLSAAATTATDMNKTYIRNACNLFKTIEIIYAGNTIYSQPYVVEQNNEFMLKMGDSYLDSHPFTYTTRNIISNGTAYLALDNGTTTNTSAAIAVGAETTIKNIMIPINQIFPIFQDITSQGFPVRALSSQIEFRLYINEPYRYLVDYRGKISDTKELNDFTDRCYVSSGADVSKYSSSGLEVRYPNDKIQLKNVKMYCANYVADEPTAAQIDSKCGPNGDGEKIFRYYVVQSALRQVSSIGSTNILPFSITTNNEKSFLLYCYKTGLSPSLLYRPSLNSVYIQFGANQIPFQPISSSTFETPYEYKFTVDDVLDNIDTYFTETNHDYNDSYRYITKNSLRANITVPTSSFVIMGANFSSDPSTIGIPSSSWNSQYQAHFNGETPDTTDNPSLTFVLSVRTEMGLVIRNGELHTVNI